MLLFIYLYALLISSMLFKQSQAGSNDIALGLNTYSLNPDVYIAPSTNSFITIISLGTFIDKTLLLRDIFYNSVGISVLSSPKGWGKTTNLEMMKLFLKIQVHPNGTRIRPISETPNYYLFTKGEYHTEYYNITLEKPLLISKEREIIDDHLGKHPVIHLTFEDKIYYHKRAYEIILDEMVSEAFHDHLYMLEVYDAKLRDYSGSEPDQEILYRKEVFMRYLKCEEDEDYTIDDAVAFLSEELQWHFKRKPFILIDEVDRFLTLKPVYPIFKDFLYFSIECNEYAKKAILTGILPIKFGSEAVRYYDFQGDTPFQHYYSFTAEEMDLVYAFYKIPAEERELIQFWYGGYHARKNIRQVLFNPRSVCQYLNTRQFKSYSFNAFYNDTHLTTIFQNPSMQYALSRFLIGKEYVYQIQNSYPLKRGDLFSMNVTKACNAIEYLIASGYVTTKKHITATKAVLKIPNKEVTDLMQRTFAKSLDKLFTKPDYQLLNETALMWEQFLLSSDESRSGKLDDNVYSCFRYIRNYLKKIDMLHCDENSTLEMEALIYSLTVSLVSSKRLHFLGWHFHNEDRKDIANEAHTPSLILSSNDRGIIINVYDEYFTNAAINQTYLYIQALEKHAKLLRWKDIIFVTCKIVLLPFKHVEIASVIHHTDFSTQPPITNALS